MDSLGKLTDMLIAVLLLFFVPVMWGEENMKYVTDRSSAMNCREFLTNICEKGYLGVASYEAFTGKLPTEGGGFEIDISHVKNDETGEAFYTSEILDKVYSEGGYEFENGDEVTVRIHNREVFYCITLPVTGGNK